MSGCLLAAGWAVAASVALASAALAEAAHEDRGGKIEVTHELMEAGEALYMVNCRMCHGTRGTAGVRLNGNERVGDDAWLARVILIGPGYMTGFADHLDDDQIALIATYVRNAWDNDFGVVTADTVAAER